MEKIKTFAFDDYEDYEDYPIAHFAIASDIEKDNVMDKIRQEKGYIPFFAFYDKSDQTEIWFDGWYDFYLDIDVEKEKVISFYCVVVANDNDIPDNEDEYDITEYIDKDACIEWLKEKGTFNEVREWYKWYTSKEEVV